MGMILRCPDLHSWSTASIFSAAYQKLYGVDLNSFDNICTKQVCSQTLTFSVGLLNQPKMFDPSSFSALTDVIQRAFASRVSHRSGLFDFFFISTKIINCTLYHIE